MTQVQDIRHHTRTCIHRDLNTAGLPAPVLHPSSFVLDISVVAERKYLSHPETCDMASQSAGSSSRALRSRWHPTKSSISFAKSNARPEGEFLRESTF